MPPPPAASMCGVSMLPAPSCARSNAAAVQGRDRRWELDVIAHHDQQLHQQSEDEQTGGRPCITLANRLERPTGHRSSEL